jgi:hypothetical protein
MELRDAGMSFEIIRSVDGPGSEVVHVVKKLLRNGMWICSPHVVAFWIDKRNAVN